MRLIGITALGRNPGPAARFSGMCEPTGAMETHDAGNRLWREAEFGSETAHQVFAAPADLFRERGDPRAARSARQSSIGEFDLGRRQVVGAISNKILDQIEAVLPKGRRAKTLAQLPAVAAQHV